MAIGTPNCAAEPAFDYISDIPHVIVHSAQGWGALGIDTCAHAPGVTPLPMQIGEKTYAKGLGHHASGEIVIDLEGLYDRFEAEVGVQKQASNTGSVVFQVFVDDEKRFDSGVMRESDAAKPISLPLTGAGELRLVSLDAGDGITCDCADWAEARLVRAANPTPIAAKEFVDVAPFARVVTFDPKRMTGSKANRVQEFQADDIFLDTDLLPNDDGAYVVPSKDGRSCIGLQWLERRILREVAVEFANESASPASDSVDVQAWVGESPWQGGWHPVEGKLAQHGNRLSMKIDRIASPEIGRGTWKIRWIWPDSGTPATVSRPVALTSRTWKTADIRLEIADVSPKGIARIEMYNGEIVSPESGVSLAWDMSKPIHLSIRYIEPRSWESDRTVIRFSDETFACGIAVDDLLSRKAVWVQDHYLFAAIEPDGPSVYDYLSQMAGKETILERVRRMPDQTFEQAMAKTHNPIQDNGPTMLSLACDNHKFVVDHPSGAIRFAVPGAESNPAGGDLRELTCLLSPSFGGKDITDPERSMYAGAFPRIMTTRRDGDVSYGASCYVAPYDKSDVSGEWPFINKKPVLVAIFSAGNNTPDPIHASIALTFLYDAATNTEARLTNLKGRVLVHMEGKLLAVVDTTGAGSVGTRVKGGTVFIDWQLPGDPVKPCDSKSQQCRVFIPTWELTTDQQAEIKTNNDLLMDFIEYWKKVLEPAMLVVPPDHLLENVIRASQVHCLIAARNEEEGKRIAPWIASDRYGPLESESNSIVRGMGLMGQTDFMRKSLDFFIKRYSPEGFLTTGYTLMGTGWHLQTLGEYFDLTQDKAWMNNVAGEVERACKWIVDQRAKTKVGDDAGGDRPEYGLMPPGVGADWNAFAYHFALNGYYYAGLMEASEALRAVGNSWAQDFLADAADFRQDILDAYAWSTSRAPVVPLRDGTWVQYYPGQLHCPGPTGIFFPGEDGNRSWCYDVELGAHHLVPQGVIEPTRNQVARMIDHMEDVQFLAEGWFDYPAAKSEADWFNLGGFSKVQPYYTRNAEIYAMRDDVKPFIRSYFNTLASLLNTENLSLWEHFHNAGAWNKTHETGYFLQQTAWMFVRERWGELWLAPFVTDRWLEDGKVILVKNAPTRLGKVGYRIESHVAQGFIEAEIDVSATQRILAVHLRIRHPEGKIPKSVSVPGWEKAYFREPESEVVIRGDVTGKLTVRLEY